VVLRVEFDGFGEQGDGGFVIFGLEGFVSLIFEFVGLRYLISDPPSTRFEGTTRRTVDMASEPGGDPWK